MRYKIVVMLTGVIAANIRKRLSSSLLRVREPLKRINSKA